MPYKDKNSEKAKATRLAYRNTAEYRTKAREAMRKFRAENRTICNLRQRKYAKRRMEKFGNIDYIKLKKDPVRWEKAKKAVSEWQKKNSERFNRRDRKGTIDLCGDRYIKRYLYNIGYHKTGITKEVIEATKQLLLIKRKIKNL